MVLNCLNNEVGSPPTSWPPRFIASRFLAIVVWIGTSYKG